jgi:glycosyltransferase involved in cell wall biosynthesis
LDELLKPLVSILVPAFNAEEWIADTLRSAIAQTWKRKEIIVVDDGSTDQTLVVAQQFESDCVRVIHQANHGAAATRNKAFSLSHGDYIQWLDADDVLAPDKISKQMEVMDRCQSKRVLLSGAWGRFFYRYHRAQFVPTGLWCDLSPTEWLLRKLEQNLFMQTATWLVSRELTEKAGPWDVRLLSDDDGEYFCRVLLGSDCVRFVPDAKVFYRISGQGSLGYVGRSVKKCEAQWRSMQLQMSYLRSLDDGPRVRAACVTFLRNWLSFFYPHMPHLAKQAEAMVIELGGKLRVRRLFRYHHWYLTKQTQLFFPGATTATSIAFRSRWSLPSFLDKALARIENRGSRPTQQMKAEPAGAGISELRPVNPVRPRC